MTTVLLVEDDQEIARRAQQALGHPSDRPCKIHHVRRVREAAQYLRDNRSVDVVVSDIRLPDAQGLEALDMLRRATEHVPVVFMAGPGEAELAADAVEQGAQDYLYIDEGSDAGLARVVRHAIERKRFQDEIESIKTEAKALRRQNRELRREKERLKLIDKAKDDFISLASHQLRTPATGVKQYIGMVLEGFAGEVPEQLQPFLSMAYESNERQLAIVNDLLHVAQLDAGTLHLHRTPTDVGRMLLNIVSEQASKFNQRRQRLLYEPPAEDVVVSADSERMRMVFDNLIDNASKYTPEDRTVTVTLSCSDESLSVSVKDEGVGISPESVGKIFEKFGRVANPRSDLVGGSGLGLYWAKRIVDLHGGTIEVRSETGKGAEFTVRLPIRQDRPEAAVRPDAMELK